MPPLTAMRTAAILATVLLFSSPSWAQSPPAAEGPGAEAEKRASEHFERGMQLTKEERHAEACEEFKQSEYPEPTVATQYQLGNCHEQQEKFGTARRHYVRAAEMADAAGQTERAAFARLRVTEIDIKAAKVALVIPPEMLNIPALTILLDDEPIAKERWGKPIAVDKGGHTIKVAAPGKSPATISVSITATGETTTVTLPPLAAPGTAPPPGYEGDDPPDTKSGGNRALFWTGVGLTPGGGILTALGVYEIVENDDADIGGLFIALGGACIATGVTFLVLFRDKDDPAEPPTTTVEAVVSPTYGGLRVNF